MISYVQGENLYRDELTYKDFETYLPSYDFDEKQIDFFKDTFETIIHDRDTNKVTCFSARCGIGKSIFIRAFMHCCLGDYSYAGRNTPQGLVVVTDSIRRLEELGNNGQEIIEAAKYWGDFRADWEANEHYKRFDECVIVLKSDQPFKEQLVNQKYKPIVLLSTQRYFMLNDEVREQLFQFSYNGRQMKRDIIIFDERPQFSEVIKIDSENLAQIESALYKGLSNEVPEKDNIIKEYKAFKDRLLDQMTEEEKVRADENIIMYWKNSKCNGITQNDELFFRVLEDNIEPLYNQYNRIFKDLQCLKELALKGAIYHSIKKKSGKYQCYFSFLKDNRDYFYLGGDKKFFVFDATADIDPHYNLDYVEIINGKKYNKPLNMIITNVPITTSKRVMCMNKTKSEETSQAIINYLKKQLNIKQITQKEILVIAYSELVKKFEKQFTNVAYYGNIKGFNDFRKIRYMAHIGMNRFPNMEYFYIYCGCHMDVYEHLIDMTENESVEFFDSIVQNKNKQYSTEITEIMLNCMLADFEQNIFRLAIRDFQNREEVQVWTFYNNTDSLYSILSEMIERRYKPYNVQFEYEDMLPEVRLQKTKNRKPPNDKELTNAQKILKWREQLSQGTVYKIQRLLQETGLSNKQFQKAKENNPILENIFELDKTEKRGYYKVHNKIKD